MTRSELIQRLLIIPQELIKAEQELLKATQAHTQAKTALECREADLILCGVDGKNEAERKARIHVGSLQAQEVVSVAAAERDQAAIILRSLQNEFSALRSVARLLAGTEE